MLEFASQIINGLAIGNVYALLALGFTLVFGVARLINFAQGSLFMIGAYLSWTAVAIWNMPLWLAFIIAVAATTALGLLIDALALRPLSRAAMIAPLLSTLAVSVMLDRAAELIWSPTTRSFPNPVSGIVWQIGSAYISAVDLIIFGIGIITMVLLVFFLQHTWAGQAMRATAQDPEAAQQMGINVARIRQLTFGLASGLGGIGGILVGMYYQSIFPAMGLPYGLKGFAAALLGGIASVPGAITGGMLLGIFESLASGYIGSEYRDLVAYALLLGVLLWRPHGFFGSIGLEALGGGQAASGAVPGTSPLASTSSIRPAVQSRRWQLSPRMVLVLSAMAALLPFITDNFYVLQVAVLAIIFAVLTMSLTIVSGTTGQISLGHAALFGVGAYTAAILTTWYNLPTEIVLLAAGLITLVVAVLSALPTLKLSGHTVVIATLAIGQIMYIVFLTWIPLTRGPMGIPGIPAMEFSLGGRMPLWDLQHNYWVALLFFVIAFLVYTRLLRSPIGRAWRAIREDRLAAHASGVPVPRYITMAFACAGFFAGIAGALYAYLLSFVSPDSFFTDTSILLLTMAVLGGLGNLTGALFGGMLLTILPELFRPLADYRLIMYGLVLLLVIRFRPQGIAGTDS